MILQNKLKSFRIIKDENKIIDLCFARSSRKKDYKKLFDIILIIRFCNIFKVDLDYSIKKCSRYIHRSNLNLYINKIREFFNLEYTFDELSKINYKKHKRKYITNPSNEMKTLKTKSTKLLKYGDENYNNIEKMKSTKLLKYGDENYVNFEKGKETKLEKYNDENYNNFHQICKTKFEKYNDENYNNREKCKETNIEKFGCEWFTQSEEYKSKVIKHNIEKYNCEYYFQTDDFKNKSRDFFKEKYGVESIAQIHFKNFKDLNKEFVIKNFIKNKRFLLDNFKNYFNISSNNCVLKYKKEFDIFYPSLIQRNKKQINIYENINYEKKYYNYRYKNKEIDIFIPDKNLGIEFNGLLFHSIGYKIYENQNRIYENYHLDKTEFFKRKNINILHIFEGENIDLWLSMIHSKLGLNKKIFARKCIIKEISSKEARDFCEQNHLQGYVESKIRVGLFYNFKNSSLKEDLKLVQVMTFSKSRYDKSIEYELIRLCSLRDYVH